MVTRSFYLLVGPSGSGKNAIIQQVVARTPDVIFAPSLTTRSMRPGEKPGSPYVFVDEREFSGRIHKGDMVEHEVVHGNLYGISRTTVEEILGSSRDAINDIEVYGALKLMGLWPSGVITIFIKVSDLELLRRRIIKRQPEISSSNLEARMDRARFENAVSSAFHYRITNDGDLASAVEACQEIIARERAVARREYHLLLLDSAASPLPHASAPLLRVQKMGSETPNTAVERQLTALARRSGVDVALSDCELDITAPQRVSDELGSGTTQRITLAGRTQNAAAALERIFADVRK